MPRQENGEFSVQDIAIRLRQEMNTAQALLKIQSELGRMPNSQWRDSMQLFIQEWFSKPAKSASSRGADGDRYRMECSRDTATLS